MTGHITDGLGPSIDHCPPERQYHAPARTCPVCSLELPAGCDPRWLQPPSGTTGIDMRTVQMNGRIENGPDDKSAPGSANSPGT